MRELFSGILLIFLIFGILSSILLGWTRLMGQTISGIILGIIFGIFAIHSSWFVVAGNSDWRPVDWRTAIRCFLFFTGYVAVSAMIMFSDFVWSLLNWLFSRSTSLFIIKTVFSILVVFWSFVCALAYKEERTMPRK